MNEPINWHLPAVFSITNKSDYSKKDALNICSIVKFQNLPSRL